MLSIMLNPQSKKLLLIHAMSTKEKKKYKA